MTSDNLEKKWLPVMGRRCVNEIKGECRENKDDYH
jgi:hypothetical protein